jgi:hypothetical protein
MKKAPINWQRDSKSGQEFVKSADGENAVLVYERSEDDFVVQVNLTVLQGGFKSPGEAKRWAAHNISFLKPPELILCDDWRGIVRVINKQLVEKNLKVVVKKNKGNDLLSFHVVKRMRPLKVRLVDACPYCAQ